jgi:hypothetical protein
MHWCRLAETLDLVMCRCLRELTGPGAVTFGMPIFHDYLGSLDLDAD